MPVNTIIVFGRASNKIIKAIDLNNQVDTTALINLSLMQILQLNNIPVASSCSGDGVCQKCVVYLNNGPKPHLSCQLFMKDFISFKNNDIIVTLTYL